MKVELNHLRVMLCLSIILTHILTRYTIFLEPDSLQLDTLYWIRNIFITATPAFIILSVLLTTLNYKKELPKGYLVERIKYLLVPYILVAMFYCYSLSLENNNNFLNELWSTMVLANWHGYFIFIIMQFAIFTVIIYKIDVRILSSKIALVLSFVINVAFLYSYYEIEAVNNFFMSYYPLSHNTIFLGWIFFYFFGAFIGLNYESIKVNLQYNVAILLLMVILSYILFIVFEDGDHWTVTSFHYSLIPLHASMFLLMLYIATSLSSIWQNNVRTISNYSLFIFLFHPVILPYIYDFTEAYDGSTIIFISLTLLFILGICIGIGILLAQYKIFRFVLGKQPYKVKNRGKVL